MNAQELDILRELNDEEVSLIDMLYVEYGVNIQHASITENPDIIGGKSYFNILVKLEETGDVFLTPDVLELAVELGVTFYFDFEENKMFIRARRSLGEMVRTGLFVITDQMLKEASINESLPIEKKIKAYDKYLVKKFTKN